MTDEVRGFNLLYTRQIGLMNRRLPATDLTPPEARVLYDLARAPDRPFCNPVKPSIAVPLPACGGAKA